MAVESDKELRILFSLRCLCKASAKGEVINVKNIMTDITDKISVLEYQAEIHDTIFVTRSPIHEAAYHGHLEVVQYFLENYSHLIDINQVASVDDCKRDVRDTFIQPNQVTLFMAACCGGNLDIIRYLVKKGVDVDKETPIWGPPILIATAWGKLGAVKYLHAEHGARINEVVDGHGRSPLLLACASYNAGYDVVEYLLAQGADVHHNSFEGYSAIHLAAASGKVDVIRLLLANGASPSFQGSTSNPYCKDYLPCPLYVAAAEGHKAVVDMMVDLPDCPLLCKSDAYLVLAVLPMLRSRFPYNDNVRLWRDKEHWKLALQYLEESPMMPAYPPLKKEYGYRSEFVKVNQLVQVWDTTQFNLLDMYYQAFMIAERCLGLYFVSPIVWKHNMALWFGAKAIIVFKIAEAQYLTLQSIRLCLGWLKNLFYNPYYNGNIIVLMKNLRGTILCCQAALKKVEINEWIFFPSYIDLVIDTLDMFKCLYDKALKNNFRVDSVCCFTAVDIFLMFVLSVISDVGLSLDGIPSLSLQTKIKDLTTRFLYQPFGSTLIHQFCMSSSDIVDVVNTCQSEYTNFRKAVLLSLKLLLSLGGDKAINHCDMDGDRPIHIAVKKKYFDMSSELVTILLENGAHVDAVDKSGATASDYCAKDSPSLPTDPLPLFCCAARSVIFYNIPYHQIDLPEHIIQFIQLHDTSNCQ